MCVISTRRPSTVKVLHQRLGAAHVRAVDIAVHAPKARGQGPQFVHHGGIAEIAGVPYFIAAAQVVRDAVVEIAVGVGEQANARHAAKMRRGREIGTAPYLAAAAQRALFLF